MEKSILVMVPNGEGGYGDFLFALKLCEQIKAHYASTGQKVPEINLLSHESGKEQIERLGGDIEFSVPVLTPELLKAKLAANEIDLDLVIEGPVWGLSTAIDDILSAHYPNTKIPYVRLSEYNHETAPPRATFKCLQYKTTVHTGLINQGGVLLSQSLMTLQEPPALMSKVDPRLSTHLLSEGEDVATYLAQHNLGLQYSHDRHDLVYKPEKRQTVPLHYLKLYNEYTKNSSKENHDALLIGSAVMKKIGATLQLKNQLMKEEGFSRLTLTLIDDPFKVMSDDEDDEQHYYSEKLDNAATAKTKHDDGSVEYTLYDSGAPGKTFRVFYMSGMSHESMNALVSLSGPIMSSTGDQSFVEGMCHVN